MAEMRWRTRCGGEGGWERMVDIRVWMLDVRASVWVERKTCGEVYVRITVTDRGELRVLFTLRSSISGSRARVVVN